MRKVYPNARIPHLWYHQTQDSARNARGSLYFERETIYSYGAHFPIASLANAAAGQRVVLLTTNAPSITTTRHTSMVRRAIPSHTPTFHVARPTDLLRAGEIDAKSTHAYYRRQIEADSKALLHYRRGRLVRAMSALDSTIADANRLCELMRWETRFQPRADLNEIRRQLEIEARREARREAARKKQAEALHRQQQIEQAALLEAWLAGQPVRFPFAYDERVYLRAHGDGVETSRGASIPLEHARRILSAVRSGTPFESNGKSIAAGVFRVNKIDELGNITAGCHYIERAEIDRLATVLGW